MFDCTKLAAEEYKIELKPKNSSNKKNKIKLFNFNSDADQNLKFRKSFEFFEQHKFKKSNFLIIMT
jgi:hypothetical protein